MDKNFRILGKISVADILLIALFIAAMFFLKDFAAPVSAAPGSVKIHYTLEIYRKDKDFINNVKIGERLFDIEKGYEIGKIIDVYELPYLEDAPDYAKKEYRRAEVDGIKNIYVVVEADAQVTDMATSIGQYQVMVGKEAFVRTKHFAAGAFTVIMERVN